MDNEKLISKIFFEIQKDPSDYRAYEDVFSLCRSIEESDFKLAHDTNAELRSYISRGMKTSAYAPLYYMPLWGVLWRSVRGCNPRPVRESVKRSGVAFVRV